MRFLTELYNLLNEKKNKGLWANIHAKRKRGEKSDPRSKSYKAAKKAGQKLNKETIEEYDVRSEDHDCFMEYLTTQMQSITEADYQGRKVKLGKPTRGDSGKFKVYVKNPKGNIVKVNFGAKGKKNRIKKDNPGARASFRARHKCDTPGPKHKARYWSCRNW